MAAHRVEPLGQLIVVLVPHHLKEVQVSARERRSRRIARASEGQKAAGPVSKLAGRRAGRRGVGGVGGFGGRSPVQRGVLVLSQLVNDWLDAQHEELVPEVEAELQVVLEEGDQQTAQ